MNRNKYVNQAWHECSHAHLEFFLKKKEEEEEEEEEKEEEKEKRSNISSDYQHH
jgi:hypothetical protein